MVIRVSSTVTSEYLLQELGDFQLPALLQRSHLGIFQRHQLVNSRLLVILVLLMKLRSLLVTFNSEAT